LKKKISSTIAMGKKKTIPEDYNFICKNLD
jgi:hypothetical protein